VRRHPLEQHPLVEQASVQIAVGSDSLAGQEAPETDSVVEADQDDTVAGLFHHFGTVPVAIGVGDIS
jgi:hypothetical protein